MADDPRPDAPDTPDAAEVPAEDEPTRFRVADTGWPPPTGSAGAALPRRTPGASGGPGSVPAAGDDVEQEPQPDPADVRSGWVTSPPLDDEPWAGLPASTGADAADSSVTSDVRPAPEPAGAPDQDDPDAEPDGRSDVQAEASRTSGRHRGPKGRHGRPRRGLGRHASDVPEPAATDSSLAADRPSRVGASDAVAGTEPEQGAGRAGRARNRRPALTWPTVRLGALALAVVAALVFGVLTLVTRVWPGPAGNAYTSSSTKAALAAASAVAVPILSYDYTTIDKKAAQLAPLQTASCATQYQQLLATTVEPLAVQNKATQKAAVLAVGVSAASQKAVTVLAFMQLTSSNSVKKGTAINEAQISVSMVKQHGRWLLAGTSANGAGNGGTPSCGGANPTAK